MLKVDAARRRCMNSRSHPTSLLLLAVALTITASPALGQQRDSLQALKRLTLDQLMNIEVTSVSRRAERLAQTASAIQVITQEDIRQSGATSFPEALRLAANLQVAQIDSRQWAISARGFNSTSANKLLVLIDGRTVYTPLFSGVFWDVQDVLLSDVDRIEVISGPGATLWGANAVNGVINVITGKNLIAKWGLTVSANSDVGAQMYCDRTHRDIPGTFGEDLDIYDVDLQHRALLARHDVVWGVGYRLINDRVANSPGLAFLPPHVARQWFTAFVQDELALVAERLHVTLGTKVEHNDNTGFEIQPGGRLNRTR